MQYVLNKKLNETFTINFIGNPVLLSGDTTLSLKNPESIYGLTKITDISYITDGIINNKQYLKIFLKYKNNNSNIPCDNCWSDPINIKDITTNNPLNLNPNDPFDFEITFYRIDDNNNNPSNIYINSVTINGNYKFNESESIAIIDNNNNQIILKPKDIYKVFSINDYEIIERGNIGNTDIKFRVTQNNGRFYSDWEPLTKENISTFRFNELRFAQIEYLITQINQDSSPTIIYDIVLKGDFQNVSANYLKINRYGLREDCLTNYYNNTSGNTLSCGLGPNNDNNLPSTNTNNSINNYGLKMDYLTQNMSCYIYSTTTNELNLENNSKDNQEGMWNPYETTKITDLANKIANDINSIFAWDIDYHLTDPDENGTDMSLHEYQLYNIVDVKSIKILVPDNKFPDNTITMNKFTLDLMDTFEIHILKDEFKSKFGIERRPGENDILYFCDLNRLYRVKHAQVFREIMNAGIYWKVILEKYEQKANIRNLSIESKDKIEKLTKNTTIDELFGKENKEERDKIANKEQTKPITNETTRHTIYKDVIINDTHLYNGNIDFASYYYDFSKVIGKKAITYRITDKILNVPDNRTFISWFNFNNEFDEDNPITYKKSYQYYHIDNKKNFNLLNNYDELNKLGYRYWYNKNKIIFQINETYFMMDVELKTNIWYGLVIILNQRQEKITMEIYKRPGDYNIKMVNPDTFELATVLSNNTTGYTYLINNGFKPIDNQEIHNIGTTFKLLHTFESSISLFDFDIDQNIEIIGSDIKYTNLRIFNDIIPKEKINNILNQNIIVDENKLILADNANRKLYADNFPKNKWD